MINHHGRNRRDLAKALGKTETEVSRWLSGTHNITIATIAKIAVVLGDDIIMPTGQGTHYVIPEEEAHKVAEE